MKQVYKIPEVYFLRDEIVPGSILRTLAYFDVFNYPLTFYEIFEFCDLKDKEINFFKMELDKLVIEKQVKNSGKFFYLGEEYCISKRKLANAYSETLLSKSQKYSRIISRFPFVRGVCISGSLAKKNAHHDADVDYFIITEKNRLWICRTLLALYKKIFLLNSRKYFCINYFVDTNNLEIKDQNKYTATEIAFLLPVYGQDVFLDFMASNTWVSNFYPDKRIELKTRPFYFKEPFLKRFFEFVFDNFVVNLIDNLCLKLTILYRQIKFRGMGEKEFNDNMKALKGVSKHHPHSFQNKVLRKYQARLISIQAKVGLGFN